jgi:hypothetical protein
VERDEIKGVGPNKKTMIEDESQCNPPISSLVVSTETCILKSLQDSNLLGSGAGDVDVTKFGV